MKLYIELNDNNEIKNISFNDSDFNYDLSFEEEEYKEILLNFEIQKYVSKLKYVEGKFVFLDSNKKLIDKLRLFRDIKLKETDYLFLSDTKILSTTTELTSLKNKRQQLRDITNNLENKEEIISKFHEVKNIY